MGKVDDIHQLVNERVASGEATDARIAALEAERDEWHTAWNRLVLEELTTRKRLEAENARLTAATKTFEGEVNRWADQLDALKEENARLRAALERCECEGLHSAFCSKGDCQPYCTLRIAREALAVKP